MCGELSAEEGVTAEEGEGAVASVMSAAHSLRLQQKTQLQRLVHGQLCQSCLRFKWSCAKRVSLCSRVVIDPIGSLWLTDLHGNHSIKTPDSFQLKDHITVFAWGHCVPLIFISKVVPKCRLSINSPFVLLISLLHNMKIQWLETGFSQKMHHFLKILIFLENKCCSWH